MLQGTSAPTSKCTTAAVNLFGPNDACSRSIQKLFNNDDSFLNDLFTIANCPKRISDYKLFCIPEKLDVSSMVAMFISYVRMYQKMYCL